MHPVARFDLARCHLRPLEPSDAPALARAANNRRIWRNVRDQFPHPYALDDAVDFIDQSARSDREVNFAIVVDGAAAGVIGLMLRPDVDRVSAEVGYWLAEDHWGRGIATEALRAVTAYGLQHHQLTRVFAYTFEWNPASARVLEKAGYVLEGRLRRSAIKDGQIVDQRQYAFIAPG